MSGCLRNYVYSFTVEVIPGISRWCAWEGVWCAERDVGKINQSSQSVERGRWSTQQLDTLIYGSL